MTEQLAPAAGVWTTDALLTRQQLDQDVKQLAAIQVPTGVILADAEVVTLDGHRWRYRPVGTAITIPDQP